MKITAILSFVLILAVPLAAAAPSPGPATTVRRFYRFSDARSALFDRRHIETRKRWYTPELYQLFRDELKKQDAYLKDHPRDKPFFGDGLDFAPLQEVCTVDGREYRYRRAVGDYSNTKGSAFVKVTWSYPAACHQHPIRYRIILRLVDGQWLVGDVDFLDGTTLVGELKAHKYG